MNKVVSRSLLFAGFVGGLWLAGTGVAAAAEPADDTSAVVSVRLPLEVVGEALSLTGDSAEDPADTASGVRAIVSVDLGAVRDVVSGDAAAVTVSAPVTVSGNAVSVLGDARSVGSSVSSSGAASAGGVSSEGHGLVSGLQGVADVAAPVTVSGNAVSVLGDATSVGSSVSSSGASRGAVSNDGSGLLSGVQAVAGLRAPVTVSGNAVSVLGDATSVGSTVGREVPGTDDPGTDDPGTDDPGAHEPDPAGPGDRGTPGASPAGTRDLAAPSAAALAATGDDGHVLWPAALLLLLIGAMLITKPRRR